MGGIATNRRISAAEDAALAAADSPSGANPFLTASAGAGSVPSATTTVAGKLELATQAEVNTGTDSVRAVTPETLANRQIVTRAVSSNGSIALTDEWLLVDTTGGAVSLALPSPATKRAYRIKDVGGDSEANPITLTRNAAEEIEGVAASRALSVNYGSWVVIADGTDWWIL